MDLRVPRRFTAIVWAGILVAAGLVAGFGAVLWWTGVPTVAVVVLVLVVLAFPVWLFLPLLFGSGLATLDADGVRARIYPWDRHRQLVPWVDVTAAWIAPISGHRYLHLALHDPDRHLSGSATRRSTLAEMLDEHGTPFLVYVTAEDDGDRVDDAVRAVVDRCTGGRIQVTGERPDALPQP